MILARRAMKRRDVTRYVTLPCTSQIRHAGLPFSMNAAIMRLGTWQVGPLARNLLYDPYGAGDGLPGAHNPNL